MTTGTIAIANLVNRPLRTMLLVFSIVLATMTGAFALSMRASFLKALPHSRMPQVVSMSATGMSMPLAYEHRMQSLPGVLAVEHQLFRLFRNPLHPETTVKLWLASDGFPFTYPPEIFDAPSDVRARWNEARSNLIVNRELATVFGWHENDVVSLDIDGENKTLSGKIVGFSSGSIDVVVAHYDAYDHHGEVSRFSLGCRPGEGPALAEAIDKEFMTDGIGTVSMTQAEFLDSFMAGTSTLLKLFDLAAVFVALIVSVLLLCSVLVTFQERLGEVATLRALGFTRTRVVSLFLQESFVAAFAGASVGATIAYMILRFDFGNVLKGIMALSHIEPSLVGIGIAFLFALSLGLLLGSLPSLYLLRRQEGADLRA